MSNGLHPLKNRDTVYLVAGSLTRDLIQEEERLGGSVAYTTLASRSLGVQPRVVTSFASNLDTGCLFDEIETIVCKSSSTTTFRNREVDNVRRQELLAIGDNIPVRSVPQWWRNPDVLHLAPVYHELDRDFAVGFDPRLCGATLQGWLRQVNDSRDITFGLFDSFEWITNQIDIAVFSEYDINHNMKIKTWICDLISVCIETVGAAGCRVYEEGKEYVVKTHPRSCGDTTGAGDMFATALFLRYFESGNAVSAAEFANTFTGRLLADKTLRDCLYFKSGNDA